MHAQRLILMKRARSPEAWECDRELDAFWRLERLHRNPGSGVRTLKATVQGCLALLEPWRQVIASVNESGQPLSHYPGSPGFALQFLRKSDRVLLNELHPEDHGKLAAFVSGDNSSARCSLVNDPSQRA